MSKPNKKYEVMNAITPFTADYVRIVVKGKRDIIGEVDQSSADIKEVLSQGFIPVNDAVLPQRYQVPRHQLKEISYQDFISYVNKKFKEALVHSDKLNGLQPGKLFSQPHADGKAWYEVVKVGAKQVEVEWRGYALDGWVDNFFGLGGKFPKSRIDQLIRQQEYIKKLFTRSLDI